MSIVNNGEPSISILECSRRSAVSHTAINKAIKEGRLTDCVDNSGKKAKVWYNIFLKEADEIGFNFRGGYISDFREDKAVTDIICSLERFVCWSDKHKLNKSGFIKLYKMLVLYRACLLNPEPVTEFAEKNILQYVTDPDIYYYFQSGIYALCIALEETGYKEPVREMGIINKALVLEIKKYYPAVDISRLKDIKVLKAYIESDN